MKIHLSLLALLGVATLTPSALAYCRTTTCDTKASCAIAPEDCCVLDSNGCDTRGLPLVWPTACVSYAIQEDGSPVRGISAEETSAIVDDAFAAWSRASCASGTVPDIQLENLGFVSCGDPVFQTEGGGNANVWMFRDDGWTHASRSSSSAYFDTGTLALTTVSFHIPTGHIYDADVEFNSARMQLVVDAGPFEIDLPSIATHEAGHFLGLDHTTDPFSTMQEGYTPGTTLLRTLSRDDENGICAIYPAGREVSEDKSCRPYGGFESSCSEAPTCSANPGPRKGALPLTSLLLASLWGVRTLRRRSTRAEG